MKPLKQLKRLLLLLCLIVGAQSSWAQTNWTCNYLGTHTTGDGITYYVYNAYYIRPDVFGNYFYATLANINATGDVVVGETFEYIDPSTSLKSYPRIVAVGWYVDQQIAVNTTCTSNMTSLSFLCDLDIYGNFTLQNLYGSISFSTTGLPNGAYYTNDGISTIKGDAVLNVPHVTTLNFSKLDIEGTVNAPEATDATLGGSVSGTINAQTLTNLNIECGSFTGKLNSSELRSVTLGNADFGTSGKLMCSNLRDIYIPDKTKIPTFSGVYGSHFIVPENTITVHVYDMTPKEISDMKNSATWSGFKQIVNHKSSYNYTLTTTGGAELSLLKLNDNVSYVSCNNMSLIAKVTTGSRSGMIKAGDSYAVEIKGVDPNAQIVKLKRNGYPVELGQTTDQGEDVYFYDETNLQEDVNYEVSVEYRTCEVSFTQENYRGNISYSRWLNGETTTGGIYSSQATMTWPRGAKITLSIPYDQYTPQTLKVDGVEKTLSCSNGVATATFYVPSNKSTSQVLLTWAEPQVSFAHHQPQIMIMRSGEGDVLFKGLCQPEEQAAEAYEQQFGYPADEYGIVVSAVANCLNTVTTVTVPDYDFLGRGEGYTFDATEWGMRAEITPVAGQTLKTLLVGWLKEEDGRKAIEWEDILHGAFSNYVQYNEGTNTYTFNWGFDEMNVWIGDYIINIVMGPEESAVETGKTLNFVRKGGRGQAWIYWHDTDWDFYFNEDGSSTKVIPDEQLTDLQMTVQLNEGESMHVYKDGVDITGQFQQRESSDEFWAELEKESATYTLLIEESPDANPTWTVLQSGEMTGTQVVITRNGEDETTTIGAATTMTIDDVGVEKVTLKVPVGHLDPVVQYKVMLDAVENENTVRIYLMNTLGLGRFAVTDLFNSLPALIPIDAFDTEEEAQAIVDALASKGGTAHTESGNYGATQTIADNVPIKVFRNGEDMTFQMTYGDPLYAIYEVPADVLTNATWEVSFDTSHRQTIYRKGGTGEVEIAYGYLSNDYNVPLGNGFTTIDLPAYDYDAGNVYVEFSIEYVEGEKVQIYRNGIDVTRAFGEPKTLQGKQYYDISDFTTGPNTLNALGFILRDPASWEIIIKEARTYVQAYVSGGTTSMHKIKSDGELESLGGGLSYGLQWINNGEGVKVHFVPNAVGKTLTRLVLNTTVIDLEDERLVREADGTYTFTITAEEIPALIGSNYNFQLFAEFENAGQYDVNNDGDVNISDVTKLVNKILEKPQE